MAPFVYWPYDEVTFGPSADYDAVVVTAPWLKLTVPVNEINQDAIEWTVAKSSQGGLAAEDAIRIQPLLQQLAPFPLVYILPTPKSAEATDSPTAEAALPESWQDMLTTCVGSPLPKLARDSFAWDMESALAFAQTKQGIHPESLLTVVRRFHLIEGQELDQGRTHFTRIGTLPPEEFKRAASILVRQNHFVTQQCQKALRPALNSAGRAKKHVEEFLKEEQGHDLILGAALKSMVPDPETIPVSNHTRALMRLLEFVAGRNLLAFAMVVNFFERSTYEEVDPLAQLLFKGGFDKAARQINRHKDINDAGGHENIALQFLHYLAPVTTEYASEALRLAELTSAVMNGVTGSAIELL